MIDQKLLIQLVGDMERAEEEFNRQSEKERAARLAKNDAYDKLSDLQKQFDCAVVKMKAEAPYDSCWGHQRKMVRE